MELIINENLFLEENIIIKEKKNHSKILYNIDEIILIGLPFEIHDYKIKNQSEKYITINIENSPQKNTLEKINNYFIQYYHNKKSNYNDFIINNTIKIKKNNYNFYMNDELLLITINNLKAYNININVQLFTI